MRPPRIVLHLDPVIRMHGATLAAGMAPLAATATLAQLGGATGVSLSLHDAALGERVAAARLLQGLWGSACEIEITPDRELLQAALALHARRVILAAPRPGDPSQLTSLDLLTQQRAVTEALTSLQELGSRAILRIPPDIDQVKAAHRLGATAACLHVSTHPIDAGAAEPILPAASAAASGLAEAALSDSLRLGRKLGMAMCIGGDVGGDVPIGPVPAADVAAIYLGRAVLGRAILVGIERAVRDAVASVVV